MICLRHAEKILALKVAAPVILIRNLHSGLFNGTRGKVHALEQNIPPIIYFKGRLIVAEKCRFEVYDPKSKSILAVRNQYPLKLAFGLTVHRAQGQTLDKVEVDCFSFFAPGQMGVAVDRAVSIEGLRIINYNSAAAHLKHPQSVYDFYATASLQLMLTFLDVRLKMTTNDLMTKRLTLTDSKIMTVQLPSRSRQHRMPAL